jgi:tripartite-type tricarboxylate transporter receptor subunit TctC
MKKLFAIILAVLSLSVHAKEIVTIIWPFDTSSNQANFIRVINEEANKIQNKYTFIYDNKPGAGGSVGAKYVLGANGITLLSSSSSFFVRPFFYPADSHNVDDFQPVMIECNGQPYSVISSKYKSLNDIQKEPILNIGVGIGSLTEAVARELQTKLPNTKLNFIGYSGTVKPMIDLQSGVLDLSIGLPADTQQHVEIGKINVIGSSGKHSYPGYPTFTSQGLTGFEDMVSGYGIYAPSSMNPQLVKELNSILTKAAKRATALPALFEADRCIPANSAYVDTVKTFNRWKKYWPEKLNSLK